MDSHVFNVGMTVVCLNNKSVKKYIQVGELYEVVGIIGNPNGPKFLKLEGVLVPLLSDRFGELTQLPTGISTVESTIIKRRKYNKTSIDKKHLGAVASTPIPQQAADSVVYHPITRKRYTKFIGNKKLNFPIERNKKCTLSITNKFTALMLTVRLYLKGVLQNLKEILKS